MNNYNRIQGRNNFKTFTGWRCWITSPISLLALKFIYELSLQASGQVRSTERLCVCLIITRDRLALAMARVPTTGLSVPSLFECAPGTPSTHATCICHVYSAVHWFFTIVHVTVPRVQSQRPACPVWCPLFTSCCKSLFPAWVYVNTCLCCLHSFCSITLYLLYRFTWNLSCYIV